MNDSGIDGSAMFSPLTIAAGLHASDRVVRLDGEHLLERVRRAVGLKRPHLHLAEALPAELRLPPTSCWVTSEYGPVERAWICVDEVEHALQDDMSKRR